MLAQHPIKGCNWLHSGSCALVLIQMADAVGRDRLVRVSLLHTARIHRGVCPDVIASAVVVVRTGVSIAAVYVQSRPAAFRPEPVTAAAADAAVVGSVRVTAASIVRGGQSSITGQIRATMAGAPGMFGSNCIDRIGAQAQLVVLP